MPTVYKADARQTAPVPVVCEVPGYPNRDADGNVMYDNTHFENEADAWERLIQEHAAGVKLFCGEFRDLEVRMRRVKDLIAKYACLLTETQERYEWWKRERQSGEAVQDGPGSG